ncbi:MAG: efflux RND transporter periplasmic adaptor subunit [Deltaproteobacteria bacterium]|nr:efflux RND transporter periplasmic adaptor subunit [Deltaproteobacteria bacterium]
MGLKISTRMDRGVFLVALILTAVCVAACSRADETGAEGTGKTTVSVETATVRPMTFRKIVRGIGTVDATEAVVIRPEIAGIVRAAPAREGMEVDEGDLLFRLDDDQPVQRLDEQSRALEAAEARLENTQSSHRRLESLWKRKVIAKDRWDRIQAELDVARAEVKRLQASVKVVREQIDDTRIRAPFAGVLSERLVDPGDLVQPGQALVTLYRIQGREVVFKAPGRYAGVVKSGQPVEIAVDAYSDRSFSGRLFFVSPELDPRTRGFQVKAAIDDPENLLKPGMFARVQVIISTLEDRPAVPEEALVPIRTGYAVFVVENGRAGRRTVEIGLRRVGVVEIVKGLQPGETIVRKGHFGLEDGDPVQEAESEADESGSP